MSEIAKTLSRALRTCTSECNSVRVTHNRCAAFGAKVRHFERFGSVRALIFVDRKYFGDDLSGFLNKNGITDPYVKPVNIILIVQRCIADRSSGKAHRLNDGFWR